jgi:ribosome maturation factor RimP
MRGELTDQLESIAVPIIGQVAAELIELKVSRHNKMIMINILADKPKGGITIDECAYINKMIVRAIEEDGMFGEDFTVEVSSPGLDRPLKTAKDFTRVIGKEIRIHLKEKIDNKLEHTGSMRSVNDDAVLIEAKNNSITIPLKAITKAVQVI